MKEQTNEGNITFEQLPTGLHYGEHKHAHKPWAIGIILIVFLLFGGFWYYQTRKIPTAVAPLPVTTPPIAPAPTPTSAPDQPMDPNSLQAAVINTAIPDYSDAF